MATFAFEQPQMMQKHYLITAADGSSAGEMRCIRGGAIAKMPGNRQVTLTKASLLSNKLVVVIDGQQIATYRVLSCSEAARGSVKEWLRQLLEQAGAIELGGKEYRFSKVSSITRTEYTWSLQTRPDAILVRYHHVGLGVALKEKGAIEVADALPAAHSAILVPLGLFLAIKANRDSSVSDGGVSSAAATTM